MEPSQDKTNLTETTELEGTLPSPVPFHNSELEKLLGQNLTAKEVELLRRFNDLTSSEILNEVRLPENGAPSYRALAALLGFSNQTIIRVTEGIREPKEKLTLSVRRKLLNNWAEKDKGKDPSQDEVKAERVDLDSFETEIDETLPIPPVFKSLLEELVGQHLDSNEIELLVKFNQLSTSQLLFKLSSKLNLSQRDMANLLGASKSTIGRAQIGETEAPETLVKTVRNFLLENWRGKDHSVDVNSSREETNLNPKKHEGIESSDDGTQPSPIKGKLQLFDEPLTDHQLGLLKSANDLTAADILLQLKQNGISNKEVARRLGMNDSSHISKIVTGKQDAGPGLRAKILKIALDEKSRSTSTIHGQRETTTEIPSAMPSVKFASKFFGRELSREELGLIEKWNRLDASEMLSILKDELGLSLRELGEQLGLDHGYLGRVIRRDRNVGEEHFKRIADFALKKIQKS